MICQSVFRTCDIFVLYVKKAFILFCLNKLQSSTCGRISGKERKLLEHYRVFRIAFRESRSLSREETREPEGQIRLLCRYPDQWNYQVSMRVETLQGQGRYEVPRTVPGHMRVCMRSPLLTEIRPDRYGSCNRVQNQSQPELMVYCDGTGYDPIGAILIAGYVHEGR